MQKESFAYIFPPFTNDFRDHPFRDDLQFKSILERLCREYLTADQASVFNTLHTEVIDNELLSQELTYLYCLAVMERFTENERRPSMVAGYSMGLYAALCCAVSIEKQDGMDLLREAWHLCRQHTAGIRYGMAAIIGLERRDIEELIRKPGHRVVISNQNADLSWIISGIEDEISQLCSAARLEGALNVRSLPATIPYHHPVLSKIADDFRAIANRIRVLRTEIPLISLIDQKVIRETDEIRDELVRNLYTPLCWMATFHVMENSGITSFVEYGPSRQLVRNARFLSRKSRFSGPEIFK